MERESLKFRGVRKNKTKENKGFLQLQKWIYKQKRSCRKNGLKCFDCKCKDCKNQIK